MKERGVSRVPPPDDPAMGAWRSFLQAHAALTRRLEAELQAERNLLLADYDVLVQLAAAPGRQLRMTDLADRVLLSRSGMTRRIDRLAAAGLVARSSCPSDRRGAFAVLTAAGLARLRAAAPVHRRGICQHFASRLAAHDVECLTRSLEKLLRPEAPPRRDATPGDVAARSEATTRPD